MEVRTQFIDNEITPWFQLKLYDQYQVYENWERQDVQNVLC